MDPTGITVTHCETGSGPTFAAALDAATADWRAIRANDLRARGNALMRQTGRYPTWHYDRADALDRGELGRQVDCGQRALAGAACPCCGRGYAMVRTCGSRWCAPCERRTRLRLVRRLVDSLKRAEREAWAEWTRQGGHRMRRPRLRLLTLTVPHSGVLDVDRARLTTAWRRMRAWMAKHDWSAYSYVARHEMTAGNDGRGHWHMHVALFVPWLSYAHFASAWARALEYAGAAPPDWGGRDGERKHRVSVESAASYIAKYVSKSVDTDDVETCAKFYTTAYAKRLTHASVGFWSRTFGCCGVKWHRVACDDLGRLEGAKEAAQLDVVAWRAAQNARPPPLIRREVARIAAATT